MRLAKGSRRPLRQTAGPELSWWPGSPKLLGRSCLLITIDTESDDLWARKPEVTFENIKYLPALQKLFDKYNVRPTYLVSYPVATSWAGRQILKPIADAGQAEMGSHMHVWTTPPMSPLTSEDHRYCPLASELSYELLLSKMSRVTDAVGELSGIRPVSYRAGRFGLDCVGLRVLEELNYLADTSVTPQVNWAESSFSGGTRGSDFRSAPLEPYYPSKSDVARPGSSSVLEVPISIFFNRRLPIQLAKWLVTLPRDHNLRRILRWCGLVEHEWLSPVRGTKGRTLIRISQALLACGVSVLNVVFHSSEMAPGTSPSSRTQSDVDASYEQMTLLLNYLIREADVEPITLRELAVRRSVYQPLKAKVGRAETPSPE